MDEKGLIKKVPDMEAMRRDMYAVTVSDTTTRQTIADAWKRHGLLLEPHGAVGWAGLNYFREAQHQAVNKDQLYVVLETAHPAKFPEQIQDILRFDPELPPSLEGLEDQQETYGTMAHDYEEFREYLLKNY